MPLAVAHVDAADSGPLSHAILAAFGEDGFNHIICPQRSALVSEGSFRAQLGADQAAELASKRKESWRLKAVDEGDAQRIPLAYAHWLVFAEDPWRRDAPGEGVNSALRLPHLEGDGGRWERQHAFCKWMLGDMTERRKGLGVSQGPHCYLSMLFTDPKHARKGAASLLVRWATDYADEKGIPCVVEASPQATQNRFYHKHGFEEVQKLSYTDQDKFPEFASGDVWVTMMVRMPKGKKTDV